MPLHKNFQKLPIPLNLDPSEDVFILKLTGEIFRDYDDYFKRVILCNSMQWTCSLTSKTGLTYEEALESEKRALKLIESFPKVIENAITYFVDELNMKSLKNLCAEIFNVLKEIYFIGEQLLHLQVKNTSKSIKKQIPIECKVIDMEVKETIEYIIEISTLKKILRVNASDLSRPKNQITKEKLHVIIRNQCEVRDGIWRCKKPLKAFNINQFYKGELKLNKSQKSHKPKINDEFLNKKIIDMTDNEFFRWRENFNDEKNQELNRLEKEYEREEQMLEDFELRHPKEDLDCKHLKQLPNAIEISTKIPIESFGDALFILEFLTLFGNNYQLKNDFPHGFYLEHLEDALYSKKCTSALSNLLLFYLDSIFKCIEQELSDADVQDVDSNNENNEIDIKTLFTDSFEGLNNQKDSLLTRADQLTKLTRNIYGRDLHKIGLDDFTISEMLRLFYITINGASNEHMTKYWFQQRGGFSRTDDLCVEFVLLHHQILNKLESKSVFELESSEKLAILLNLTHQLMSHVKYRSLIDDCLNRLTSAKHELRELQLKENGRLKELKQQHRKDGKALKNEQQLASEARKLDDFLKKEKKLHDVIFDLKLKYNHLPIGRDRYFNRYWLFKSINGLFIESNDGKQWKFYDTQESIENLIESLNERGLRESELKQFLLENKTLILNKMEKCPHEQLISSHREIESISNENEFFAYNLQEKLLSLEERINNGSIGKIENRLELRKQIKSHTLVQDLGNDLLLLQKCIEKRFYSSDKSLKHLKNWDQSLCECKNYSQIYIHLQILDDCIKWSKSLLNAKCEICKKKDHAKEMKLCSKCDCAYHESCSRQEVDDIHEDGKFLCKKCSKASKKRQSIESKNVLSGSSKRKITRNKSESDFETDVNNNDDRVSLKSSKRSKRNESSEGVKHVLLSSTRHNQSEQLFKLAEKLVGELIKSKDSWSLLKIPSGKSATKPLDLGSIKHNLYNFKYSDYKLIINDLNHVFDEFNKYYQESSDEFNACVLLYDFFLKKSSEYGLLL